MVSKKIRGAGTSILITGIVLGGVVYAAQYLKLGTKIKEGSLSLGHATGDALTLPFVGITEKLNSGLSKLFENTGELGKNLGTAGADFQETFTGNRDAIGDFFNPPTRDEERKNDRLDVSNLLTDNAISKRLSAFSSNNIQIGKSGQGITTASGGFKDQIAQETALQKAIRESKEKYSQFFK